VREFLTKCIRSLPYQIGAGVVPVPLACFVQALDAFATAYL